MSRLLGHAVLATASLLRVAAGVAIVLLLMVGMAVGFMWLSELTQPAPRRIDPLALPQVTTPDARPLCEERLARIEYPDHCR
jgi:hypothetical protein